MTISASIVADSIHPNGSRLTTFMLRYPRFIHAEFMTHRVFSRNASSSRAIPVKEFHRRMTKEPAMPEVWMANQPGMQGYIPLTPEKQAEAIRIIDEMRDFCAERILQLDALGLHKQTANRYGEPWHHIDVMATATEVANFFALRYHPMAQPEFQILATKMLQAYEASKPKHLQFGDWHLPLIKPEEREEWPVADLLKFSVARCARTSRSNHDGTNPDPIKDMKLHDDLVVAKPLHASPAEHQAQALDDVTSPIGDIAKLRGNFALGWGQYRKMLPDENITVLPKLKPEHAALPPTTHPGRFFVLIMQEDGKWAHHPDITQHPTWHAPKQEHDICWWLNKSIDNPGNILPWPWRLEKLKISDGTGQFEIPPGAEQRLLKIYQSQKTVSDTIASFHSRAEGSIPVLVPFVGKFTPGTRLEGFWQTAL